MSQPPIIIKRVKKGGHGHHGGAWKVAYADFVTAMMAFFLLMWLLNATDDVQKRGIANYFQSIGFDNMKGGGRGLLQGSSMNDGAVVDSSKGPLTRATDDPNVSSQMPGAAEKKRRNKQFDEHEGSDSNKGDDAGSDGMADQAGGLDKMYDEAKQAVSKLMEQDQDLKALSSQIAMDKTAEGLRLQILDSESHPMFERGKTEMAPNFKKLLSAIAPFLQKMNHPVILTGHTDATPFTDPADRTNFELSCERASIARKWLVNHGLSHERVAKVQGLADRELWNKADAYAPENRRISITVKTKKS